MTATLPVDGELRSVSIATHVLDLFREHEELGPTQVARELGIAKSTAHQMLVALSAGGLLDRSGHGRYRLSLRLFDYGRLVLERLPLRQIARPVLVDLHECVHEMVQLGLPALGNVYYVERVGNGGLGPLVSGEVMRRVPGYSSSAGRAMAAFDDTIGTATLEVARVRHTPMTVVDTERLQRILTAARSAGWVRSTEQSAMGYSSVAAPVFSHAGGRTQVLGAISVVGTTSRITGISKDFYVAHVTAAARRVTDLMTTSMEAAG